MGQRFSIKTKKGYDYFEVISALQKSIRRGLEEDAMYWAAEMYHSGFDQALWKRLRIIGSEDVGLAEPLLPATLHALHSSYFDIKKGKESGQPSERLFLTQAVLLLVRARKSRVVCHASISHLRCHDERQARPIPDWAHDQHTKAGKAKGRGLKHFFEEGAQLANQAEVEGEAEYLVRAQRVLGGCAPDLFEQTE